jgi:Flp pilus assembly protein TadD
MKLRARGVIATALVCMTLTGCGGNREAREEEAKARAAAGLRDRSQALIENGNQAFRAGDYALAARRYAAAAVIDDSDPAAYYGLGMALSKLGRDEQARAAYTRARELVKASPEPDDAEATP